MKHKIIGLIGYKQVGKSTAAQHLESKGYNRHNFKDALLSELKERFPDLLESILKERWGNHMVCGLNVSVDDLFEEKPPLVRTLMQNYGTEVRRKDNPDYWVNQWKKELTLKQPVVVDDVRFLNEANAIKERGGILIRLTRDDVTTGGDHQSETEQDSIVADYEINCSKGDFEHLHAELDKIVQ